MATLTYNKAKGRAVIQGMLGGKRFTLSVPGKVGRGNAESIRGYVNHLIARTSNGETLPTPAAAWLKDASDELHGRLVQVGLVAPRNGTTAMTLETLFAGYTDRRPELKPNTLETIRQTKELMFTHFGKKTDPRNVTKNNAADFRRWLVSQTYAPSSISLYCRIAKSVYADAIDRELLADNPFKGMKQTGMSNPDRQEYVSVERFKPVLNACPNAEWRAVFALARFGGLRTPSETLALKWADINWERGRFLVRAPKTERHRNGGRRIVPLFPELRPYLQELFDQAEDGAVYVVSSARGRCFHQRAGQIIAASSATAWQKTFQNLRASRETDLAAKFPIHVVCEWIGNSAAIAAKHYLMVTEEHFGIALQDALRHTEANGGKREGAMQNTSGLSHNRGNVDSVRECNQPVDLGQSQQVTHLALQKALHPKQKQAQRLLLRLATRKGVSRG